MFTNYPTPQLAVKIMNVHQIQYHNFYIHFSQDQNS